MERPYKNIDSCKILRYYIYGGKGALLQIDVRDKK
jgi:hypothetical protein